MGATSSELDRVKLLLLDAAIDPEAWISALSALAESCGGSTGQLIARDSDDGLLFQWLTNVDPDFIATSETHGFASLAKNPRLRLGRSAPVMQPVTDQDLVDREARRRHSIYGDLFERFDVSYNCQAVLYRGPDLLLRTSVSKREPFAADELARFAALIPFVQSAVRQQLASEERALSGMLAASEAAEAPVFVLNSRGRLIGATCAAEAELAGGGLLSSRGGRLRAASIRHDEALQSAVAKALAPWNGGLWPDPIALDVYEKDRRRTRRLTFSPLRPQCFRIDRQPALLIGLSQRPRPVAPRELRQRFGLTEAEAEVALLLAQGVTLDGIAKTRGVSIGTVRLQLKSIFGKTDVHKQGQLVALLSGEAR